MNPLYPDELEDWWMRHAKNEAARTIPKVLEYGSGDLAEIGRQMAGAIHRNVTEAEAVELGISFYAVGKMARIMEAIKEGRRPSVDSWFDLAVYAKMAQRVRHVAYGEEE